jgi:hypothetical protein
MHTLTHSTWAVHDQEVRPHPAHQGQGLAQGTQGGQGGGGQGLPHLTGPSQGVETHHGAARGGPRAQDLLPLAPRDGWGALLWGGARHRDPCLQVLGSALQRQGVRGGGHQVEGAVPWTPANTQ